MQTSTVAKILNAGKIAILPTDTVYGLASLATDASSIKKLFTIKNRPFKKPINVLAASLKDIESFAILTEAEKTLIKTYMPGALTLIVKKKPGALPDILTAKKTTVGVRIPNEKTILKVLEETGPLAVTSANFADEPPVKSLSDLPEDFKKQADYILDIGELPSGVPSTIAEIINGKIKILRQGEIKI